MMKTNPSPQVQSFVERRGSMQPFVSTQSISYHEGLQWNYIHLSAHDSAPFRFHIRQMDSPIFG